MADASQLVFSIPSSVTIPGTSATSDTNRFLTTLSNWMQTREGLLGDGSQKVVTLADLQELGLVPDASKGITQTYDLTSSLADSEGPGAPRDLVVASRVWANELSWTNPTDADLSHIEVWCATASQSRDDAELIALVTKPVVTFSHGAVSTQQSHTYWIRAVDYAGNHSAWCPPDAQGGYVAPPGLEHTIAEVLAALQGRITEDQLYQALVSRINTLDTDGITIVPDVFESGVIGGLYDFYLDGTRQDLQFKSDVATLQDTASDHFSRLTDLAADSANLTASLETLQTALGSLQDDTQSLAAKDVLLALDISGLHSTAQAQLDRIEALDAQVSVLIADDFDVNNFYTVGQYVRYDGKIYCCIQDITSTPAPLPTETAYWKESPDIVSLVGGMETRVDALENRITTTVSNASFNLLTNRVTAAESTLMQQADEISLKVAQGSFDILQDRVSGAEAEIAVQAEQITSKVDQDTFNVLQGRVTTAESSIVQNANAITLTASQADLDTVTNQVSSLSTTVGIHSGSFEVLTTSIVGPIALLEGVAEHGIMAETFADVTGLDNRLSLASLRIDSAEANINLRATQASVDAGINTLSTRIGNAEIDINAAEGVLLQHTQRLQEINSDLDSVKDTAAKSVIDIDAISGITSTHTTRISSLTDSVTTLVTNSEDHTSQINDLTDAADALDTLTALHTGQLNSLATLTGTQTADINNLLNRTTTLETRVSGAETSVNSLTGITGTHTTRLDTLTATTNSLGVTSSTHTTQISSAQTSLNAIKGQWTVKLQQDGTRTAVAGVGLMLDPVSSASEFMVIADKFMVVDPATSSGAAPLVPFVIGEVAGQYAVGIDGNLVVDGTIMGRHIDAGAITAAHLAADLAVVNTIRSGNYSAGTNGWKLTGTGGEINSGVTINGNLLVNGSIVGSKIAANTITAANIAAATITGAQIKANSLNASTVLASNSISTSLLQAGSITADKIAAGSITAENIAAHCITSDQIVVDGVDIQSIARGVIKEFVVAEGDAHYNILTAELGSLSKAVALIFLKHTTTATRTMVNIYRNGVLDRQVTLYPPVQVEQNQTYIVSATLFGVGIYCTDVLATAKILLISYK